MGGEGETNPDRPFMSRRTCRLLRAVAVAILFAAVSNQEKLVTPRLATLDTKIHIGDPTLQTATFISTVLLQVNDFLKVHIFRF